MFFKKYNRLLFFKNILIYSQLIMMESSSLEEKNIIKVVRNVFRLKKELDDITIKGIRNFFRLEKEIKVMKYRIIRDIKNLFQHEEKDYYKLVKVVIFGVKVMLNMKVKAIEKHYQLKNVLMKLNHT